MGMSLGTEECLTLCPYFSLAYDHSTMPNTVAEMAHSQASALMAALFYGVLSLSMSFLNKAVISQYRFNFPLFILSCQMMLTFVVLEVMRASRKFGLPHITMSAVKMFALPAFCYSMHATLSLVALEGMNIPMYGAIKRCTPLFNLILSVVYLKKPMPSPRLITSIMIITFGCSVAAMTDPTFNGFAFLMGGASVLLQSLQQTLLQQCGENHLSPLHVLHLNSCISVVPFIIFTILQGELTDVLTYEYIQDTSFHMIFTLLLLMGLLLNFSMFLCTMLNCALTTSVVGVTKSVFQTIIGFFAFGGVTLHPVNVAGIALNTTGGVMYTYEKYQDQKRKLTKTSSEDTTTQQDGWELKEKMPVI